MKPDTMPPDEPTRQRRARPWRYVLVVSGLLLASTFFMPAVSGCNETIVPAGEVRGAFADTGSHVPDFWAQIFLLFIAAYLWGLVVGVCALLRLARGAKTAKAHDWALFVVVGLAPVVWIAAVLAALCDPTIQADFGEVVVPISVALVMLAYGLVAAIRLGRRAYLAVTFIGSLVACLWFGQWVLGGYYGVRLSFLASLAILVATVAESKTLTRRGWLNTLWRLITCRLRDADIPRAACPKCQYDLYGTGEMRCPECGRPFTFDELGLSPTELGFHERLAAS